MLMKMRTRALVIRPILGLQYNKKLKTSKISQPLLDLPKYSGDSLVATLSSMYGMPKV